MDLDKITLANITSGGAGTPYPHVYENFCNYRDKTRIQPVTFYINPKDKRELEENLIFGPGGGYLHHLLFLHRQQPALEFANLNKHQTFTSHQAIAFDILKVTKYHYKYLIHLAAEYRYID